MTKPFNTNYRKVKLPKQRSEFEEFGAGKSGLVVCGDCNAAYYKKSWHHSFLGLKSVKEDAPVNFTVCPACKMGKDHQFEGEVRIMNVPEKSMEELLNLIKGFCERARQADPMDRLIDVKSKKGQGTSKNLTVTVTENQLANKLGKKIKDTFNKVKVRTSFNKEPGDTALVAVEFLKK